MQGIFCITFYRKAIGQSSGTPLDICFIPCENHAFLLPPLRLREKAGAGKKDAGEWQRKTQAADSRCV